MRWNNVGLLGGRAIVEMLQTNKTLTRIELAGNNIPADILKAIGMINRGSYMSAHVLLNLLNELGKRDKT